jgi:hypothetical protein
MTSDALSLNVNSCLLTFCSNLTTRTMSTLISRGFTNKWKVVLEVIFAYVLETFLQDKTGIGHITFQGLISQYLIFLSTSIPHRSTSIRTLIRDVSYYSEKTGHIDSTRWADDIKIIKFPLTCMTLQSSRFGHLIFRLYDNTVFRKTRFLFSVKTMYMLVSFSVYVTTRHI